MAVLAPTEINFGTRTPGTIPLYAGIPVNNYAPSAGGDSIPNDGRTFIAISNSSGGSIKVTVACVRENDQGVKENMVSDTNGAGGVYFYGPFPTRDFNDYSGSINLTYSSVTNLQIAVYRLGIRGRG